MSSVDSEFVHLEVSACTSAIHEDASSERDNHCKKRSSYFTALEQRVLLQAYEDHAHIFRKKSNKAAAAKAREAAWKNIAARVNACNSSGEKRTWIQLKMKYKNMIQKANRKRAEACRTDGELLIPPLTEAEGLAISQISPIPVSEVISEDASPEPGTIQDAITDGVVYVVEPPATTTEEKVANRKVGQHQDGVPSASTAQLHTLPVNELYKHHLLKTIEKMDKEMMYLDRQIRKADLEILLLERQIRE
ncbi:hypothetical protein CHARACLAT_001387 [Characodon lateralis]|uniref:Myb/SANT-like DNA-binding domain-containing protein n=1 Tax=Characodon lateralis TaxID=208331 RepID=A0ABU7E037_9TELE|nr:hypothetical protein [Characodon lateralis]